MPKQRPETERAKAENLIKPIIENDFNQSAAARQLGIKPQTLNEQFHRKPVQDVLQEYLNSRGLKKQLAKVAKEGLAATKVISAIVIVNKNKPGTIEPATPEVKEKLADEKTTDFIDIVDHKTRHKFWRDLMLSLGKIKNNGNGKENHLHFHFTVEERNSKLDWLSNFATSRQNN